MKIISDPDIDVVGSISRDEDGWISVRLTNISEAPVTEKFRIFIDNEMVHGEIREPKEFPPEEQETVYDCY